ncbi:MAG: HEAT repeat domain-containing protein [Planctomycetota bacterium]|nr:HEAT repeat domain-containing protein [Planctomycetota bacterium]
MENTGREQKGSIPGSSLIPGSGERDVRPGFPDGGRTRTAPEEISCDSCGQVFSAEHLRTGKARVVEGAVTCPLCRLRSERKGKKSFDLQLVGSAVLLFVVAPVLVLLLLTHWEPASDSGPVPDRIETEFAERMEARLERLEILLQAVSRSEKEGEIRQLEKRIASLEAAREKLASSAAAPARKGGSSSSRSRIESSGLSPRRLQRALTQRLETVFTNGTIVERLEALARIDRLRDPEQVRLVRERLEGDDEDLVRTVAAEILGRLGDSDSLPALRKLSDDSNLLLRHAVKQAVKRIGERNERKKKSPPSDRGTR